MPAPPETDAPVVAISSRCMHLGCPVRWTAAAQRFICPCHGGVYGFTGEVVGGPPVRPLDRFYTRMRNGQVEVGPRYSVNSEFDALPELPRSGPAARRHRPVPLPRALLDAEEPMRLPTLPKPPVPKRFQDTPARPGEAEKVHAARAGQGGRDPRRGLGRRAHLALRRRALDVLPQGPEGDELVLHARLGDDVRVRLAGDHRRVPGDVLHAVADPGLRVGAAHHQRRLPRRVRARHAQVGLVGDGDPDLPAHGRGRSSSARTSTRAS